MKILITGSRTWNKPLVVKQVLNRYNVPGTVLIHGGATGADTIGKIIARSFGWSIIEVPADWDIYGDDAGPIRNREMLDMQPDVVVGFLRSHSHGTMDCLNEAERRGLPTVITKWEEC